MQALTIDQIKGIIKDLNEYNEEAKKYWLGRKQFNKEKQANYSGYVKALESLEILITNLQTEDQTR